jgi:hypothetical protein
MVEWVMIFGIGFLVACVCLLMLAPAFHERAVRLTTRRVLATMPITIAEAQAEVDRLRAEFAVANRRLEVCIDNLNTRLACQYAETGKKAAEVHNLKVELDEKNALIAALQGRPSEAVLEYVTLLDLALARKRRQEALLFPVRSLLQRMTGREPAKAKVA